jgi:hypothetical protein
VRSAGRSALVVVVRPQEGCETTSVTACISERDRREDGLFSYVPSGMIASRFLAVNRPKLTRTESWANRRPRLPAVRVSLRLPGLLLCPRSATYRQAGDCGDVRSCLMTGDEDALDGMWTEYLWRAQQAGQLGNLKRAGPYVARVAR